MKTFRTACDPWGVTVERVEVRRFCESIVQMNFGDFGAFDLNTFSKSYFLIVHFWKHQVVS